MYFLQQMKIDGAEYQQIEDLKNQEKKDAEDHLYKSISKWTHDENAEKSTGKPSQIEDAMVRESNTSSTQVKRQSVPLNGFENDGDDDDDDDDDKIFGSFISHPSTYPSVRGASCIRFKHTPRIFKTPLRESTVVREKEFLIKNRPFLRYNKHFNTECTDISDADPMWLKRKGDEFYTTGDFVSAINAYTEAFEKDSNLVQAITNRSACYLYIGEAQRCIIDSEEALKLIKQDAFETNLSSSELKLMHKKMLVRMANAHCQSGGGLNHFKKALKCLNDAKQMVLSDSLLFDDIQRVSVILEALKIKFQADDLLSKNQIDESIMSYNDALSTEPTLIGAKINCATALLLKGRHEDCLSICEQVLEVFRSTRAAKRGVVPPISTIPLPGSARRRDMVIACLIKKAEAHTKLGQYDRALEELKIVKTISISSHDNNDIDLDIGRLTKLWRETKTNK